METMPWSVLDDRSFAVPQCSAGAGGVAWLRGSVARFSEDGDHARRRGLVEQILSGLVIAPQPGGDPTAALLAALGLPEELVADVESAAAAYHPHLPVTPEADQAVERLVAACGGGHDESTAARLCILVQAHAATRALIDRLRDGGDGPPVPLTRRIGPRGETVEVDLSGAPFGSGPHACPGRDLAYRLAEAAMRR
ncbi:hypothetical protein [Actinomadura coerulea]|uniref:hypothetical protein n=1 Tax=Actinomadura coerulea TaxID=46159 RepID=UPI0034188B0B